MKNIRVLLIAAFLIVTVATLQQANAQVKTKEEQEQELRIQQAINEQKQVLIEQKKAQEEMIKSLQEKANDLEFDVNADRYRDGSRWAIPRGSRSFSDNDPFIFGTGGDSFYLRTIGESERTTWDFSRSVKENTFTKDYTFDVEKTAKSVVMSVMGDCKAGEIRISIVMPNGKNYSDIVIDEFGNLNWRKSFVISETENQDKTGTWKFQIASNKATGYFKISLQSN